ncbi:MAG: electron transfer flavoprotein subunit beta/FixA family protein [Abditibacteriota bacterium]|nr:electron transfer flavoprotein subunit beta/FixA family protein [Abditibacteriota bacterium]
MNIAVCIKQVPGTTEVRINPETNTLVREGVETQINPFDLYALEEAVRIKEQRAKEGAETAVTVVTMGPPQADSALREAISLGADKGVLLCDRAFAGADTWCTSFALSLACKRLEADLVICGQQAIDGDTGQVGPGIATHLSWAQASYLAEIREIDDRHMTVRRLVEDGYEVCRLQLPCVVTVVKEINEPRTPSLRGRMASKKAVFDVWTAADLQADPDKLGLAGSPTRVVKIMTPPSRTGGDKYEGDTEELADKLFDTLSSMEVI